MGIGIILGIVIIFLLYFLYIRLFISGLLDYQLNKNALKKRKKGQTFAEWLLYTRFRTEIPKFILWLYYFVLLIHGFAIVACLLINLFDLNFSTDFKFFDFFKQTKVSIDAIVALCVWIFDSIWHSTLLILFWSPNGDKYSRWIDKKRGQNRKK